MTLEELTDIIISFGERVHVIRGDGLDAVNLPVVPVAWFIAMKATGTLNIDEGKENRPVGTRPIPLAELTPEFVREEVGRAIEAQTALVLEDVIKMFLYELPGQPPPRIKPLLMSPFSPATRDEAALRRELVAAMGGDFEIFREVTGRHLLSGEPVRADLLCFPGLHLRVGSRSLPPASLPGPTSCRSSTEPPPPKR